MKLSHRDITAYIGQSPNVPQGIPYTSDPSAPWASQEMAAYEGRGENSFCPSCKSVNLLVNKDKNMAICGDCQARFSTKAFEQGNMFNGRTIDRATGLLNTDEGSDSYPEAHGTNQVGGGSASKSWGTETSY